jgi:type VI secretion system lysozyme-like protein
MALFDKLTPQRRQAPGPRARIERILRNLENVLKSRRGYSSLLPDFGMRSLNQYTSRETLGAAVIEDVRECIERYEPRLRLDSIVLDEKHSALRLSFTLKCTVLDDPHELQVSFDTVFNQFDVARR